MEMFENAERLDATLEESAEALALECSTEAVLDGSAEGSAEATLDGAAEAALEGSTQALLEGTAEAMLEGATLEPQLMDVDGVGEVLVGGDPFEVAPRLDDSQGDNVLDFHGNCGIMSVMNLCRMAGIEINEDEATILATRLRLCEFSSDDPDACGGTTVLERQDLLEVLGISSTVFGAGELGPEQLAELVEAGHGVNISMNAGVLWDEPSAYGNGESNHSIVVTGTVRDPESGALKGLIVCDSGLPGDGNSNAMFVPMDKLEEGYTNAIGASALITDDAIRC